MSSHLYPNVRLSKTLQKHSESEKLVQDVTDRFMSGIGGMEKLKLQGKMQDVVREICLVVENLVPKKNKQKLDKKQIVLDICSKLFKDLSPVEKEQISRTIDFVVSLGLKRVSRVRRAASWLLSLVCTPNERELRLPKDA
jgi:hypothetical protein